MKNIRVELGDRSYDILIGNSILDIIGEKLKTFNFSPKIALISNEIVFSLYGNTVSESIKKAGFELLTVIIPDGEEYKNIENWVDFFHKVFLTRYLWCWCDRWNIKRSWSKSFNKRCRCRCRSCNCSGFTAYQNLPSNFQITRCNDGELWQVA